VLRTHLNRLGTEKGQKDVFVRPAKLKNSCPNM
jgi:hypothetical protein